MNAKQHTIDVLKTTCLVLVLAGLLFAITALARASETEGSTEADISAQQEAPDVSATQQAPDTGYQQRQAAREARRKALLERIRLAKLNADQNKTVPAALTGINVSFKLDPRLSGPTYGGERWVSPPTYTGASAQDTVEARAFGIGANGQPVNISPKWRAADPEMVDVSPGEGNAVKITVRRAGESSLEVASQGLSKKLSIKAEYKGNILQVQLSQKP
jgi:hypothetical protein